jgi:D-inositol-3-phosphate glycosyltransferase
MEKRIAFISDHASPLATIGGVDSGGQNVYVAEVARSLANQGFLVDIYTRRESGEVEETVIFDEGVRVIHISAGPETAIPKELLFDYMDEFTANILDYIHRFQLAYDLVHAHFWLSGMVAIRLKKQFDVPFVITFHALGAVRQIHQGNADKFPAQRVEIEREIMWHAEKIIAECPNDMKDMMELYRAPQDKIEIIPCGYNPQDFYPIDKQEAKRALSLDSSYRYILQLGRIVPRKGIDNVLEAFARMHREIPDLRLLIVGGDTADMEVGQEFRRLNAICAKHDISNKVIFTGQQPREQLKYYYSAAELFITTPWYEPFGITPLEAMACGTPVIGSDVGGIAYTVRKNETGDLVSPRQPQQLASKMLSLLQDSQRLDVMRKKAVQHVEDHFTWKIVGEQIADLYEQLIPKRIEQRELQHLKSYFQQASQAFLQAAESLPAHIVKVSNEICRVLTAGGKILVCGNGGSAAESQHFVAELVGRFEIPERPAYPVLSLNTDTSVLTAWANDFGYDTVFQRQVQALGQPGDMLICLSTSGNSANIVQALKQANDQGMVTVNLLGKDGGQAAQFADYNIIVPSAHTARIQEIHLHLIHQLCWLVENKMEQSRTQQDVKKLIA